MKYGFDIGGTKIEIVAFDDDFNVIFKQRLATPKNDYSAFLDSLLTLIGNADVACGGAESIGIGMPGVINKSTGVLLSSNIPCVSGRNIIKDLNVLLGEDFNIAIDNDCKCFTLSEANGGAVDGLEVVFGAILGTGVGGGLCINGKLLSGANGIIGEWGHSPLPAIIQQKYNLPLYHCGCGLTSCIERYISGLGLAALYSFHTNGKIKNAEEIIGLMRTGDSDANQVFEMHIDILACSLASMINVYDPDAIVFGGGLSQVAELYQQLPAQLEHYMLSTISIPKLLPPRYGDSSGVRGAAMLPKITPNKSNKGKVWLM